MTLRPRIVSLGFVLFASLVVSSTAIAEVDASSTRSPGANALLFAINGDFQLGNFNGATIAFKHHTSAGSAWRFGVSPRISGSSTDTELNYALLDTTRMDHDESDAVGLGLSATRIWYPKPAERMSAYYGFGPFVSFLSTDEERGQGAQTSRFETRRWAIGASGVFGGEWFPARSIGVHAEYTASIEFSEQKEDRTEDPPSIDLHSERSGWSFQGTGVRFGASWYF